MRTQYTVALALLAGAALGAAAIQTLHAQAAPKAYVVAPNVVKDEAGYMKDCAPSTSKAIEGAGKCSSHEGALRDGREIRDLE